MHSTGFIIVLIWVLAVLGAPVAGAAQQAASLPRVGFLHPASLSDPRVTRYVEAFRSGLRELGYVEGQNIAIEFRWANGQYDRLPGLATELVRLKVDVIVAPNTPATRAARQASETIPIIFVSVADPMAAGFVASLAHPGGHITGLSLMSPELVGKQLSLLKEVAPKAARVALLANPNNRSHALLVEQAQEAGRALGVRLQFLKARDRSEIDGVFSAMSTNPPDAVIVLGDTVFLDHRTRIAEHAVRNRLATVFGESEFAEAGGLLAYGRSLSDASRRSAGYVDKILKGAKAADLPVEQPALFELVINLKTANALRLRIPQTMLQRADRIIE
jgi:putative ABC transport system substrate-binding protein